MAADLDSRIERFQRMTEADPDNDLGHFSLGSMFLEAGRLDEAIVSLRRVIEMNPKMSRAYQLLGRAYARTERQPEGVEVVMKGVAVADQQGDRIPRGAMVAMLEEWGAPVPPLGAASVPKAREAAEVGAACGDAGFSCSRCRCPTEGLVKAPFKGALGEQIAASVCVACWQEWIGMGTKVINELGLVLSSSAGQEAYDRSMLEFLQLQDG